jgi:hypothetical protein
VTVDRLAPEEPLSPELVLVLPAELRTEALARTPPPIWLEARPPVAVPPPSSQQSLTRMLATVFLPRVAQFMLIFVLVTVLILTLATVATQFGDLRLRLFSRRGCSESRRCSN